MAFFRSVLGAEEAALVEVLNVVTLSNLSGLQHIVENNRIAAPVDDLVLVILKKFLRWREICDMFIASAANSFHKEFQVRALGETGKLTGVVDSNVDEFLHPGILEQSEEFPCILLGKSYGIESNHLKLRFRILHQVCSR